MPKNWKCRVTSQFVCPKVRYDTALLLLGTTIKAYIVSPPFCADWAWPRDTRDFFSIDGVGGPSTDGDEG